MSSWRATLAVLLAAAIAAGVVSLYLGHRGEMERAASREEPIVAPSRVQAGEDGPVIVLDSGEARRIGLETAVLAPASANPQIRLSAEVLEEPERTASVRAPLAGKLAVPDGRTWPSLGDRLAAGDEVAVVSDARPLVLPMGGVVTRVGARPGEIVEPGQLLLEVVDRTRPVVRVIWGEAAGRPRQTVLLVPAGGGPRIPARLIGPAPEADRLTRRPAYLYRAVRTWPGAAPGTVVAALVASGEQAVSGALVPDRAVVQWDGLTWVYRLRGAGRYERHPVPVDRPVAEGWLAAAGDLKPGDTVVVIGAQQLLSEEFRVRVTVGDESGE
jgi:biotin carboxyl carrier protein